MSTASKALLFAVLCALTVWIYSGEVAAVRSRPRRLVEHYLNRLGAKSFVNGKRMYWFCRRGAKLAICRSKDQRIQPGTLKSSRQVVTEASCPSKCLRGKCVLGRCLCKKGWTGSRCHVDVNECSQRLHSCSHICINIPGSYRCLCRPGYSLSSNGKSCARSLRKTPQPKAVVSFEGSPSSRSASTASLRELSPSSKRPNNETLPVIRNRYRSRASLYLAARMKQRSCRKGCHYRCAVENGEEKCLCPKGFSLAPNERSCIDKNECLDAVGPICPVNQDCVNSFGGYTCKCSAGYALTHSLSGKACEDLNECLTGDHECGANARCINTIGSYACPCLPGYQKNGLLCTRIGSITPRDRYIERYPWSRHRSRPTRPRDIQ